MPSQSSAAELKLARVPAPIMFVVGDTRKVLQHCQPAGFDPVKGYSRPERDLHDPRVREAVKEIAVLDGAFVINPEGIVEKAAQLVDAPYANLTLSKGLGARHWAGAAISKATAALAIVVSFAFRAIYNVVAFWTTDHRGALLLGGIAVKVDRRLG